MPDAAPEDLNFKKVRGLDRFLVLRLLGCKWIRQGKSLLLTGPTGSGKSYLVCALDHQACRLGLSLRRFRLTRLLDDWGMAGLDDLGRRDLLGVLDDWYARRATL